MRYYATTWSKFRSPTSLYPPLSLSPPSPSPLSFICLLLSSLSPSTSLSFVIVLVRYTTHYRILKIGKFPMDPGELRKLKNRKPLVLNGYTRHLTVILQLLCKETIRVQHISGMYMFTGSMRQNYLEKSWQPLKACSCIFGLLKVYLENRNWMLNLLRDNRIELLILGIELALFFCRVVVVSMSVLQAMTRGFESWWQHTFTPRSVYLPLSLSLSLSS